MGKHLGASTLHAQPGIKVFFARFSSGAEVRNEDVPEGSQGSDVVGCLE